MNKVKPGLIRALDLKDAIGIGLGAIIGAGIFVVTGKAAGVAGPAFLVGLVIAGIAALCNGLSSAQLAAVYPHSGGTYEYGYRLLNGWFGFSAGWMFVISKLSAGGVVALGFGYYLHNFIPEFSPQVYAGAAVAALTLANLFGVKKAGIFNAGILIITLFSLLIFVVFGAGKFSVSNIEPFAPFGLKGIMEASALLFFAFTGYARIATLGEEVINPRKNIPFAIVVTVIFALILYLLIGTTALGLIGAEAMSLGNSPLETAARNTENTFVIYAINAGGVTAMLGVLLSQVLGISRMMLAMARRKDIPPFLEGIDSKYNVPRSGIVVTGVIILLLVILGSIEFIISAAAFTILIYYGIANISALRLPKNVRLYHPFVAVTGLLFCVLMSISLPADTIGAGVAILILGFMLKYIFNKIYGNRRD